MSDLIRNSIINNSPSKQRYTFPKSERFKKMSKTNSSDFYNLPEIFSQKIGLSFAKSKREEKIMNNTAKSEFYDIPREFDESRISKPAFSFGINKKSSEKVFIPRSPGRVNKTPGPGTYNYLKEFGSDGPKYTKYIKYNPSSKIRINKIKNLGPGEYLLTKMDINPDGKYFLSRLKNTSSISFGNPNSITKPKIVKSKSVPGPGKYEIKSLINGKGFLYLSNFKSSLGKTFGMKFKDIFNSKNNTLGPGQYQMFSEFGYPFKY